MKSYLMFEIQERPKNRKTDVYTIMSASTRNILGIIQWYGAWRRYCFLPVEDTVWSSECMDDVKSFIDSLMKARKEKVKSNE